MGLSVLHLTAQENHFGLHGQYHHSSPWRRSVAQRGMGAAAAEVCSGINASMSPALREWG